MKQITGIGALLGGASLLAISATPSTAQDAAAAERYADRLDRSGAYLTGDKHNHTVCTDGSTSVRTLVDTSVLVYDLDWFARTGHGGEGPRDCRFDDPEYDGPFSGPGQLWEDTIGADAIKGDEEFTTVRGLGPFREMWRWQSIIEFEHPSAAAAGRVADKTVWTGLETNVPGHEHSSMGILGQQFRTRGDAYSMGQFEYLWDRSDDDLSGGPGYDFENPANDGVEKYIADTHAKSVDSVRWMRANHARDSYYVPAHAERQGAWVRLDDGEEIGGYNVENFRDYYNAGQLGPEVESGSIAMGFESQPGHQLQTNRGSYSPSRPTAGFGTFGGTGCYAAGEMTPPGTVAEGFDFSGSGPATGDLSNPIELTEDRVDALIEDFDDAYLDIAPGAFTPSIVAPIRFNAEGDEVGRTPLDRYVFCQPGVRTMWDAMLGEGRRWFFFGSSDWHNRGAFSPWEEASTNDPWPGEYQKIYAFARGGDGGYSYRTAREVVNGMRSGNTYTVMGDLVEEFRWIMCQGSQCATMGETLTVDPAGEDVVWWLYAVDPEGTNHSPYTFPNPSLHQIGLETPLNQPRLENMDVIRGDVTGVIDPSDPAYATNVANLTTEIFATIYRDADDAAGGATFNEAEGGALTASGSIPADFFTNDMYFRVRGTNMPKGTPNETDMVGNPLLDYAANSIPCPFEGVPDDDAETGDEDAFDPGACPAHLPVNEDTGVKISDYDVEAWADLWVYGNPIFVEVRDDARRAASADAPEEG